jgi:hypothetical protein
MRPPSSALLRCDASTSRRRSSRAAAFACGERCGGS